MCFIGILFNNSSNSLKWQFYKTHMSSSSYLTYSHVDIYAAVPGSRCCCRKGKKESLQLAFFSTSTFCWFILLPALRFSAFFCLFHFIHYFLLSLVIFSCPSEISTNCLQQECLHFFSAFNFSHTCRTNRCCYCRCCIGCSSLWLDNIAAAAKVCLKREFRLF